MTGQLVPGAILHQRYKISHLLGQGGMGAVYLAEDNRLPGRQCAVKENLPDPNSSPQALAQVRKQFLAEASILARLDHPNLPKVSDFFGEGGREYLVMDYVVGEDLASALQRVGGPLPEKPVLLWTQQALDALEELHSQQPQPIIHRDIKPANLRLTPQGKIKLVDFGLVKLLDPGNPRTQTIQRGLGTPEYAPLEQYASGSDHTDARSDLYSLGATLYHLLTNVAPPDVHRRMLNPAALLPPRQVNPNLSPQSEQLILRAMAIYPHERFQSATEMKQAIAQPRRAATPPLQATTPLARTPPAPPVEPPAPFEVRQVAQWGTGGACLGTLLASLPRLALASGSGELLGAALYTGSLFFGALGAVVGVCIARRVSLDQADFLPRLGVTLLLALGLSAVGGLGVGMGLFKGGAGLLSLFLALLGSVGGSTLGIRLTETQRFKESLSH